MPQPLPFNTVKAYAAFALETTPGTAVSLANADFDVCIRDIEMSLDLKTYLLECANGDHGAEGLVPGASSGGINFTIDCKPGSAAGTAPKWFKAAMFSGMVQEAVVTFGSDLGASNQVAGSVNSVAITPVTYATSHAATMSAVAAAIVTAGGAGTVATVGGTSNRSIFIRKPGTLVNITSFAVTGGSAVTTTMSNSVAESRDADAITATAALFLVPPTGNALKLTLKGLHGGHEFGWDGTGNPITYKVVGAQGAFVSMADAANITPTGMDTTDVHPTIGINLTDGAINQYVSSFKVADGASVELVESGQDATGYLMAHTATKEHRLSWNPQADLLTNDPVWTRWRAGTKTAVAYTGPTVGGQKISISIPKIQLMEIARGARNGHEAWERTDLICKDAGVAAYRLTIGA